ncbi:endonuclease/exonuclease/phosphatase family protein [Oryzobacter sp. R7]|uniref:endonuclease/exonuclease/phosphatase family protein n=1 Tax=Oryzobacter faecalis TaxID=3388656 RepID=UPI00398CC320
MTSTLLRVGTWNLDGRWDSRVESAMERVGADVWLLTEVPDEAVPPGYRASWSVAPQVAGRHWAAVLVRDSVRTVARWDGDLHPASAAMVVGGLVFCSSVLPWRSCGREAPWQGGTTAEKTAAVTRRLADSLPRGATVWGGDWNHALHGPERAGSLEGREHLREAVEKLDLRVVTAECPHRVAGLSTIDHVAVPAGTSVRTVRRVEMKASRRHLTDHDAYVVDLRAGGSRRRRTTA